MTIVVSGAGIGGLTAALCLAQIGKSVIVFERSPAFEEVGAGLQCGANAMRVIDQLGLSEQLRKLAVDPEYIDFLHYSNGSVFNRMVLGDSYAQRYGTRYLHVHRADLHAVLLEACEKNPDINLKPGTAVESFLEHEDEVDVMTAGGTVKAECLVACDGVRSTIREQLLGQSAPQFTGNVAWRAVVPRDRLPRDYMDKIARNYVGKDKHAVIYYLRNQQLVNFVGVVEDPEWTDDSWVAKAPWEKLKADYAGWHEKVQQLIDVVDKDACYRWALYAHQPFERWSTNRVTLLGDAAHSTLPFMASGAAMAIEDGRVLARCMQQETTVSSALALYQRSRLPRTSKIQSGSEKMGKIYHLPKPWMQKAAFWAIRNFAKKQESFLPEYDANTVALGG